MDDILIKANLALLIDRFREERIEPEMSEEMRDEELIRLGVATIGERIRLRNVSKTTVNEGASTSGSQSSVASNVLQERMSLFGSRRGGRRTKRGAERPRMWTAQFVCVADRFQRRIPTSTEKQLLHQAGLGLKKIKLEATDDETTVLRKITSNEQNEEGQIVGFPQLKDCGGFEMLHCVSNCKDLTPITCSWAVKDLKANLGAQTKLYLRPIQKSLSTTSQMQDNKSQVKEKCNRCQKEFLIRELRQHVFNCRVRNGTENHSDPDEDLPPFTMDEPGPTVLGQSEPHAGQDQGPVTPVIRQEVIRPALEVIDVDKENNNSEEVNPASLDDAVTKVINYCIGRNVSDPVEVLRCIQKEVVTGRPLEIVDVGESVEGDTNFMLVDRSNLLSTAFEELADYNDFRPTLEVQFYGEVSKLPFFQVIW